MGTIEPYFAALAELGNEGGIRKALQAGSPLHAGQRLFCRWPVNRLASLGHKGLESSECCAGIGRLMAADQTQPANRMLGQRQDRCSKLARTLLNHLNRGIMGLRRQYYRTPMLDDPGLFSSNRCHGITEKAHMVEADGGNDTERWCRQHIGGIDPTPKPGLEHNQIGRGFGKGQHGRRGRYLKKRDRHAAICGLNPIQQGKQGLVINRLRQLSRPA